jgi:type III pantothenate kinase
MDRLAAVIGAYSLRPKQNCIVIDAGSCITYDFISAKGEYLGGSISLGLRMRFRALHEFTAKLPLLEPTNDLDIEYIGKSTEHAIQSGVINGFLHEINNIIDHHEFLNGVGNVLICGGDADFIAQRIDRNSEIVQTLLLQGLNELI